MQDKKFQEYVSKRIRLLRLQAGLTQEQLAEKAGLGFNYVYKLENKPSNIKIDTIAKVMSGLEIDIDTFFNVSLNQFNPEIEELVTLVNDLPSHKQRDIIKLFNQILKTLK